MSQNFRRSAVADRRDGHANTWPLLSGLLPARQKNFQTKGDDASGPVAFEWVGVERRTAYLTATESALSNLGSIADYRRFLLVLPIKND